MCVSVCVFLMYQDTVKEYIENLSIDKLPKLMEFFRQFLLTKASKPVVVYGHCEVRCVCACVRRCVFDVSTSVLIYIRTCAHNKHIHAWCATVA